MARTRKKAPEKTIVKLALEVKIDLGMPVPDGLAPHVSRLLSEYSDGRRMFDVEQIRVGLAEVVRKAVYHALEARFRETSGDGTRSVRSCLEAHEAMEPMRLRFHTELECTEASACGREGDSPSAK